MLACRSLALRQGLVLRTRQRQQAQRFLLHSCYAQLLLPNSRDRKTDDLGLLSSLPVVSVSPLLISNAVPFLHHRRYASSTSSSHKNEEDSTHGEELDARRRLRQRAEDLQEKAEEFRDSARENLREFREHPKESAVQGAKSFGAMIRLYGPVFIGTYATIYLTTLGLTFAGVESGALDPAVLFSWLGQGDEETKNTAQLVVDFLNGHAFTKPIAPFVEKNPVVANLAVAWIAVKLTEPVRVALTLGITPRVARYIGWTVKNTDEEDADTIDTAKDKRKREAPASKK
jgi:hypothetical protein